MGFLPGVNQRVLTSKFFGALDSYVFTGTALILLGGFNTLMHTSGIWMIYEYIRGTYEWHMSVIRMSYEYIQVTYR